MTTLDEHTPALDQLSKPASKSQQQTWAQDLLDTIQTNRDNHRDNHRRPTASLSRPHPKNEAEIQTLTAELMANVDSEPHTPGSGANRRDGHSRSREFAIAAQQVMGDAPAGTRHQMAAAFATLIVAPARAAAERRKDRDVGVRIVAMQEFIQLHLFEGDAQVYLARPFAQLTCIAEPDR